MKIIFIYSFVVLITGILFAQSWDTQHQDPSVQIITEGMIKSSGTASLSEILLLADNINFSTIDGSTSIFSVNNLSPYQRQNLLIMIDGQKIDMTVFDTQNLNLIPVSIDQIDYVEIVTVPRVLNGQFASHGAIHIHTKIPSKGLSVQGSVTLGDETGDPGPLSFTQYKSPNVDRIAQYYSMNVNSAGDNWYMKGAIKHEEGFKTDPAINNRISFLNKDDNKERLIGYFYKINGRVFNGEHQFIAGLTSNNDFFFFTPYANEIPVKQEFRHFGINGTSTLGNFGVSYRASQSVNELGYIENNRNISFDFGIQNLLLNLETSYNTELLRVLFGFGINKYTAVTAEHFDNKNISFKNFYGTIDIVPAGNISQTAGVFVTRYYDKVSYKGFLTSRWNLSRQHTLFTCFSYMQNFFEEDNNFWVWERRGYSFNDQPLIYNTPEKYNDNEIFSGDIVYKYSADSLSSLEIGGRFRSFNNFYLEKQFYQFNPENSSLSGITDISPDEQLKSYGVSAAINVKLLKNLFTKLSYTYAGYFDGSTLFKESWNNFPEHTIILNLNYQPFHNVGISARFKYYSSTLWTNYKYISYQSDEDYTMEIKPGLLADLSANLWLWNRQVWFNAVLRNAFNNVEKYHPAGADLDMRFFLQVHFYFNTLLN